MIEGIELVSISWYFPWGNITITSFKWYFILQFTIFFLLTLKHIKCHSNITLLIFTNFLSSCYFYYSFILMGYKVDVLVIYAHAMGTRMPIPFFSLRFQSLNYYLEKKCISIVKMLRKISYISPQDKETQLPQNF